MIRTYRDKETGISQYRLAKDIRVPPRRINEIVRGQRAITADTALRFARYFRTTEQFWLNLQTRYDLESEKDRLGDQLDREITVFAAQLSVIFLSGIDCRTLLTADELRERLGTLNKLDARRSDLGFASCDF